MIDISFSLCEKGVPQSLLCNNDANKMSLPGVKVLQVSFRSYHLRVIGWKRPGDPSAISEGEEL